MKTKLFTLALIGILSIGGLSSCSEEEVVPLDKQEQSKGATKTDTDF